MSTKFWPLLFLLLLNLTLYVNNFFDFSEVPLFKTWMYLSYRLFLTPSVFLLIFLVAKKASAPLAQKEMWLRTFRGLFAACVSIEALMCVLITYESLHYSEWAEAEAGRDASWQRLNTVQQYLMCDNAIWIVNAAAELLQVGLFFLLGLLI